MHRVARPRCLALSLALLAAVCAGAAHGQASLPEVRVIGVSPLPGLAVPRDQVPANVQAATARDLEATHAEDLPSFLNRRLGSVHVNEMQGNGFQPDVGFRGYTASPLLGAQQGLSVYLDGVRLNQPFGEVVGWDLVPASAVASLALVPGSNPLFGLNTLGGALSLTTKDGRQVHGTRLKTTAGSHGHWLTEAETGNQRADGLHWYGLASHTEDGGWRVNSASRLQQWFGKLGQRFGDDDVSVTLASASTRLGGNGLQEQQLLRNDWRSVYTQPDTTRNRSLWMNLAWQRPVGDGLFTGRAWARRLDTGTLNGDVDPDALGADPADRNGQDGLLNRSRTQQRQAGVAAQWDWDTRVFGRPAQALAGGSADLARSRFRQSSELGRLDAARVVQPLGVFDEDAGVDLSGRSRTLSVFGSAIVALADATHLTLAARFNHLRIRNGDALVPEGQPGSLAGEHRFARLNPAAGITHAASREVTFFAGASQGSRAPSAVELACSDPAQPCKLPNAFAGDPPLRQVVTTTWEAGVRGSRPSGLRWNASVFHATNRDDLLFVAGNASGVGYFRNFGQTRRQGLELDGSAPLAKGLTLGANYTLLDATFRSGEALDGSSNSSNGAAQAGLPGVAGTIAVRPGDRIPLVPRQLLKVYAQWSPAPRWSFGADLQAIAGATARGNENGEHRPDGTYYLGSGRSAGYVVVNADAQWQPARAWRFFAQVRNLLDRRHATAAQLVAAGFDAKGRFDPQPFPANGAAPSPVTHSTAFAPGAPRSAWVGAQYTFE